MITPEEEYIDPYQILNIPYSATNKEIQAAFHTMMEARRGEESELVIRAYGMIRNESGRNQMRFDDYRTLLHCPLHAEKRAFDSEELIKELAFLSPWELGDDTCLN